MNRSILKWLFIGLLNAIFFGGLMGISNKGTSFDWHMAIKSGLLFGILMTSQTYRSSLDKHVYMKAGKSDDLKKIMQDNGFVVKKSDERTTYYKIPWYDRLIGRTWSISHSKYYTQISAPQSIIAQLPQEWNLKEKG